MSAAEPKSVEHKRTKYLEQNHHNGWTSRQERQLKKTRTRLEHTESRAKLKNKQRTRRARFREWMAGVR